MSSRGTYRTALTYGAVGATQAPDLMTYPPEGFARRSPARASATATPGSRPP
ncbi:hypothetical protein P9139_12765 [Curtobacterium flaccumfaciens]|nr:hypothetical protein P9139_12765 [Curtobacterium flaccumfaciens]